MIVTLPHATVTYTPEGCVSHFADGTSYGAQPHDTPHYMEITERCGYRPIWFKDEVAARANARLAYCREHEICHHVVGDHFYDGRSTVLWSLAHGYDPDPRDAAIEEAMVMTVQRWLRAGERPIIGGVDWDGLKRDTLAALGE